MVVPYIIRPATSILCAALPHWDLGLSQREGGNGNDLDKEDRVRRCTSPPVGAEAAAAAADARGFNRPRRRCGLTTASSSIAALVQVLLLLVKSQHYPHSALGLSSFSENKKMKAEWIPLSPPNLVTPPRSGHVSFVDPMTSNVFIFGGYAEPEGPSNPMSRVVTNDMWKFDAKASVFTQVDSNDDKAASPLKPPPPRLVSACAISNHLYPTIFGGWDPQTPGTGGAILDDVHMYNPETNQWTTVKDCIMPDGPTSRHVAVALHDGRIALHTHRCTDHVLIFNSKEFGCGTLVKQPTKGEAPSSRGLHAACTLGGGIGGSSSLKSADDKDDDEYIVIFGGADQSGTMSNDVYALNTRTWTWTKVDCTNAGPTGRAGACLCRLQGEGGSSAILFGGAQPTEDGLWGRGDVWRLSLHVPSTDGGSGDDGPGVKGQWEKLWDDEQTTKEDDGPPGRNAATLTPIPKPFGVVVTDDDGDEDDDQYFLLHGGWAPFRETFNDASVLRLSSSCSQ